MHTHTTLQCALHTLNTLQIAGSTPSSISLLPPCEVAAKHRKDLGLENLEYIVITSPTKMFVLGILLLGRLVSKSLLGTGIGYSTEELLQYEWNNLSGAKWYTHSLKRRVRTGTSCQRRNASSSNHQFLGALLVTGV